MNDQHDEFVRHVRAQLDAGLENVDATTRARLAAARKRALAQTPTLPFAGWRMAGWATAAAGVLTVTLWWPTDGNGLPDAVLEDFDLIAETVDFELYEDLDFYTWLDSEEAGAS